MRITAELAEATARAAISEPYRQINVLTTREFTDWLRRRGMGLQWSTLHRLWQAAIIRPIAVLEPAVQAATSIGDRLVAMDLDFDVPAYVDLGADAPLATELEPGRDLSGQLSRCLLWHPFQLWSFMHLARVIEPKMSLDATLYGRAAFVNTAEYVVSTVPEGLIQFVSSESNGEFERVLSLLLMVEPLVHLQVNPRARVRPSRDESFEEYYKWIQAEGGRAALSKAGLTVETAITWHREMAVQAQIEDPVETFRELLRHANRDERERMSGHALRSHTLYDMAEILRRYLETYHDAELLEEDDARHGPSGPTVKESLYGARRTSDFDRAVFRRIARKYNVDPQARTTWFIEGHTEYGFITRLAEHLHFNLVESGVELMNMEGLGTISTGQFYALLERFRREETFVFIAIDEDGGGKHLLQLRRYARDGLISAGFRVWQPDFESANFTVEELASAATSFAQRGGADLSITANDVRRQMESGRSGAVPAGTAVERLLRKAHCYSGKGRQWGEALADWVFQKGELDGLRRDAHSRPIIEATTYVLRGQSSHYQSTVSLCYVDDDGYVRRRPEGK